MSIYRVDLHLHTAASPDGRSSLEGIAKAAKAAGLDAIAVTDHDLCTPVPAALENSNMASPVYPASRTMASAQETRSGLVTH